MQNDDRTAGQSEEGFRRTVRRVGVLNFGYFLIEFAVAIAISSVALFADSIDFLEDASVNLLIVLALAWPLRRRAQVGMLLAALILIPTLATLWTAWTKFADPAAPHAVSLSLAGMGALAVNLACAFMLVRFRKLEGSLSRAAFLSARNDAVANVAIIAAGIATAATLSHWPDLIVGLGIAALNISAAREVWLAARKEQQTARA